MKKWREWRANPFNWMLVFMGLFGCAMAGFLTYQIYTAITTATP